MKSFLRWVEDTAELEGSPALSEPQDKKGEGNMSLAKVVENRIKSIVNELGPDQQKKGTTEQIYAAIADYVGKMSGGAKQPPQDNQAQPQPPQDSQAQPAQGNPPASQQGMVMNPVATGNNPRGI